MGGNSAEKRKQMKRKKEVALLLLTAVLAAAGCADEKTTGEKTTGERAALPRYPEAVFLTVNWRRMSRSGYWKMTPPFPRDILRS